MPIDPVVSGQPILSAWGNDVKAAIDALEAGVDPFGGVVFAVKPTFQTVNNSTALVADVDLSVPLEGSSTYLFRAGLFVSGVAAAHFKAGWTLPSGAVVSWSMVGEYVGADGQFSGIALESGSALAVRVPGGSIYHAEARGIVITTTAGNLALAWAQQVAVSGNTLLRARSFLEARRVA